MNNDYPSEGIDDLVQGTENIVELAVSLNDINRKYMKYLPYPDWNFNETDEKYLQGTSIEKNDEQCPLEQTYLRCNKTFVPGQSVQVVKIEAERIYKPMTDFLYPYLYTITICHGSSFVWTIKKRYKQFNDLHKALLDYVKFEKSSETTVNNDQQYSKILKQEKQQQQPCFPTQNDRIALINGSSIEERCKLLQTYLNKVLRHPKFREHNAVNDFLEVSPLSFVRGLGKSLREGYLSKRSNDDYRGRSIFIRAPFICDICKFYHGRKWFVIKDSYFVYMKLNSSIVGFPMLVDQGFSLDRSVRKTKTNKGIRIKNLQRLMMIKCRREDKRDEWFDSLMEIKNKSLFTQQHRFESFAPRRQQQYAQWFV